MAVPFERESIFCNFCGLKIANIADCAVGYRSMHILDDKSGTIYNRVFNVHNVNYHYERVGAFVKDTHCSQCGVKLGWKLIRLRFRSNDYLPGRFILKWGRIRDSPHDDEDVEEGGDSNEENVDQDSDGNGLNADQHGVANEQDLGVNMQVPKEQEVGTSEPNADKDLQNKQEQDVAATEKKSDQDGANNQVQQDLGANEQNVDQGGGINEQTDDDKDGGQPTKRRKTN